MDDLWHIGAWDSTSTRRILTMSFRVLGMLIKSRNVIRNVLLLSGGLRPCILVVRGSGRLFSPHGNSWDLGVGEGVLSFYLSLLAMLSGVSYRGWIVSYGSDKSHDSGMAITSVARKHSLYRLVSMMIVTLSTYPLSLRLMVPSGRFYQ